jgi:glycosyltransferase involved in cell wall biosynthesis
MLPSPSIAFVIPCYNSEKTIVSTLDSVLRLKKGRMACEVVVVDNGSKDRTAQLARELGIDVLHCPERGRSQARNFGARHTTSDFMAFVDSDVVLDEEWLLNLMPLMGPVCVAIAQGPIVPGPVNNFINGYRYWIAHDYSQGTFNLLEGIGFSTPVIDTAACLVRRSAFEQVGGFDERLVRSEDRDLSWRLVAKGYSLRTTSKSPCSKFETRGVVRYIGRSFLNAKTIYQMEAGISQKNRWSFAWNKLRGFPRFTDRPSKSIKLYSVLENTAYNLGIFAGALGYQRSTFEKTPWPSSKVNLLLPRLRLAGQTYAFSTSKRFALNEQSLCFYGFNDRGSLRYSERAMLVFFYRYLRGELEQDLTSGEVDLALELIDKNVLVQSKI